MIKALSTTRQYLVSFGALVPARRVNTAPPLTFPLSFAFGSSRFGSSSPSIIPIIHRKLD